MTLGGRIYGLGIIAFGLLGLAWGDFVAAQALPKTFPDRVVIAYVVGAFLCLAGLAVEWRRTAPWGAALLGVYYGLFMLLGIDGPVVLAHPATYGGYENAAEHLAIAAAALIAYAATAAMEPALSAQLTRWGRRGFALAVLIFGGAHFAYLNLTIPLVPKWLPPSRLFWAEATGVCQILAAVALFTGLQARLAAILLVVLYATFQGLVHAPMLIADPASHYIWSENATNLVLTGAAWIVAESLASPRRR
jgi:uncharacterized membrane protein